eukprot:216659_1
MGNTLLKPRISHNTQITEQIKPETIKLAVVGDCLTGKTTLIRRYVYGRFEKQYKATVAADQYVKDITISYGSDNIPIRLEIWDISGFLKLKNFDYDSFWRFIDGVIFVYDIAHKQSYYSVDRWRKSFLKCVCFETNSISFMLLANKNDGLTDLNSEFIDSTQYLQYDYVNPRRLVYRYCQNIGKELQKIIPVEVIQMCYNYYGLQGELYAHKFDMLYYETSSPLNQNIHESFTSIAETIYALRQKTIYELSTLLN